MNVREMIRRGSGYIALLGQRWMMKSPINNAALCNLWISEQKESVQ